MRHLGDITKLRGDAIPVVDCIIGGSPCQDLSVAGKRAGLEGERSGLFIEQIRIIKEMRAKDARNGRTGVDIRPRYMVWENVFGSLSSPGKKNPGEDFRIVLEETAKISDQDAVIPKPPKGKWTNCGCIMGDGWSIAWRVCDAQFWGVPQRRRRIALVADFGGESAPEILFVRQSLSGHSEPRKQEGQRAASDAEGSLGANDCHGFDGYNGCLTGDVTSTLGVNCGLVLGRQGVIATAYTMQDREGKAGGGKGALIAKDRSATLRANNSQYLFQPVAYALDSLDSNSMKSSNPHSGFREVAVSKTLDTSNPDPSKNQGGIAIVQPMEEVYSIENHPADSRVDIDTSGKVQTLTSRMGTGGGNVPMVMTFAKSKRAQTDDDYETWVESGTANTLNAFDQGDVRATNVVVALDRASYNQGKNAQFDIGVTEDGIAHTVVAKGPGAVCYGINGDKAGTLDASYYKGCGMRQGVEREVVAQAVDCMNCSESDINGALQSNSAHSLNGNNVVRTRYIVRRLTPLECERLQGFPDGWTDIGDWIDSAGKKRQASDASRYKALGNSIALPSWKWVLKRLCACYERDATMASLFDGIGGFPLLWEQLNGNGTCLWASEIEDFPVAVTKARIGGDT